ncbi:MAG: hypothetical protein ACYC5N_09955 [Endomicrobiales bacterium]
MSNWLLVPPIAFMIILGASLLMSLVSSRLAFRAGTQAPGKRKAYACGEDVPCAQLQPEYSQFFPFAFFFTIMHVAALIIATVPQGPAKASGIAFLYLAAALSALFILFRK